MPLQQDFDERQSRALGKLSVRSGVSDVLRTIELGLSTEFFLLESTRKIRMVGG
jgi:hypothetical protein